MDSKVKNRLIVFDVEGVLIPKARFILFEVIGRIGMRSFFMAALLGLLYEIGLITLNSALKKLYKILEGFPLERFISHFQTVPLMPGVKELFRDLKKTAYKTALISSGIPSIVLERLAEKLGADYFSGLEISLSEDLLTGEIGGYVIEPNGKAAALKRILTDEGLSPCYCIGVADDRNNLSMFELCNLKIGYNPDYILSHKSDHVVKGDLLKIGRIIKGLPVVNWEHNLSDVSIIRKVIHISGFLVSIVSAYLINHHIIAFLISLVTVLYTMSETGRMLGKGLPIIPHITSKVAGKSESLEFVASPIFFALGILVPLVMFPEPISYVSIMVLTLGDGFAGFFGEIFGKRRVPFNKTKNFEGTASGFFFAFFGSLLFVDPYRALIASAVGMLTEVLPLPINDNLTIPLTSGIALIMASAF